MSYNKFAEISKQSIDKGLEYAEPFVSDMETNSKFFKHYISNYACRLSELQAGDEFSDFIKMVEKAAQLGILNHTNNLRWEVAEKIGYALHALRKYKAKRRERHDQLLELFVSYPECFKHLKSTMVFDYYRPDLDNEDRFLKFVDWYTLEKLHEDANYNTLFVFRKYSEMLSPTIKCLFSGGSPGGDRQIRLKHFYPILKKACRINYYKDEFYYLRVMILYRADEQTEAFKILINKLKNSDVWFWKALRIFAPNGTIALGIATKRYQLNKSEKNKEEIINTIKKNYLSDKHKHLIEDAGVVNDTFLEENSKRAIEFLNELKIKYKEQIIT